MPDEIARLVRRVATTRAGRWFDQQCVWWCGESPNGRLYAWATGVPYRPSTILTTVGRRSGNLHRVVLPWYPARDGAIAVVGSKGGHPIDPHWVLNLRADPRVWVRDRGVDRAHTAHVAAGEERAALWAEIVERAPMYEDYQRVATERELPVVILEPR